MALTTITPMLMFQQRLLIYFIAVGILFSCNSNNTGDTSVSDSKNFQKYIAQVSSGVVSVYDPVTIIFKNKIKGVTEKQIMDASIIKVSPSISGNFLALNDRTLSFEPKTHFKSDVEYEFKIDLEALGYKIPENEEKFFVFKIKTLKQQFSISTANLQSYSKNWQYLEGEIRANDLMTNNVASDLLRADQSDKKLKIKLSNVTDKSKVFKFRIDSIKRLESDSKIIVKWSGKAHGIDNKGQSEFVIPGKNNFVVTGINVVNTDDQHIEIQFSDPIKKNQNFSGLVSIEGTRRIKFTASGQLLKVYPRKELKGALKITVHEGIKSTDNYKLKNEYSEQLNFEQAKPEVRFLQNGTLLPTSQNLKINFEAINLQAVSVTVYKIYQNNILQFLQNNNLHDQADLRQVGRPIAKKLINLGENTALNLSKWNAFAIDLDQLITPDLGAIYRIELDYNKTYSLYHCDGDGTSKEIVFEEINFDAEISESSFWDNAQNEYDYNWSERDNPCSDSYFRNKRIATNLLTSNIGGIAKKGENNSYQIIAADLISTAPLSGVEVTLYNYQQQEIAKLATDQDGIAVFSNTPAAFFAILSLGDQKTYLKLNDGNALSLSKFDVSGAKLQKGIKGYLYGERGVWRPGDTLFLSFMLNDHANQLPKNHPVRLNLKDPYGKIDYEISKTDNIDNLYSFKIPTSAEAHTGNWLATVSVGGASFSKKIKIETIKPNRLKIKTSFEKETLQNNSTINGKLAVTWLHGAVARNLKTNINVRFKAVKTSFKAYPGYIFDDPSRKFSSSDQEVYSGELSEEGNVNFSFNANIENQPSGMLKASFITKVFENGGDFSTDVISKNFSPYNTYIGLNTPKGDKARGMLLTDTKHNFEIVSVNENGQPKAVKDLEVTIYKVNWRWWWDTSEDNLSSYNGGSYRDEVFKTKVSTNNKGRASFDFTLKYPDWGRYLVRVVDPNGGHATGKTIYIDWPGWAGKSKKSDPSAAAMLLFSTDKKNYTTGEKAIITFPSSEGGRALISIENGTAVLNTFWVDTQSGETKFEFPILPSYTPNVYVNITLLQPHASTVNDLPIRLYGITPILVENPETRIDPLISMPEVLKPDETITISVSEKNGKDMSYTIAMVDEGLLDLTRFTTPNPWGTFYAREALGVKTWDIYDDVIGAYGGSINQIFSIGGDTEAAGGKSKKANRFKPMVIYKGPFKLEKGAQKKHTIKIPKYIGSVRTMVIASNTSNQAYGKVEKTTPVRKPLMLLGTVPRKLTPGEKVTIPVTIFAMESKVKNANVTLKSHPGYKIIGADTQQVSFSQPDEKMVYFTIEILEGVKNANIEITAKGNGEKATFNVPVQIINPNPLTTEVSSISLPPSAIKNFDLSTFGTKGSNSVTLEFSSLPPINFEGRLKYLIQYPHGCIEQTTSAVFPQLFLSDIFEVSTDRTSKIQAHINIAIQKLKRFIKSGGGMTYWPGNNTIDDWGTSYAGHFLIEAKNKGYVLPIGFENKWVSHQQKAAKNWSSSNSDLLQAYRLYTLALAEHPDVSSMNRLREKRNLSNIAKLRLAAAYSLIGQKTAAEKLLQNSKFEFESNTNKSYGSATRDLAMALETLILLDKKEKAQQLAIKLAGVLSSSEWMSTQTTSYCLLAMAKYANYVGGEGIQLEYNLNNKVKKVINTTKTYATSGEIQLNNTSNLLSFKNSTSSPIFLQINNSGVLPVGQEKLMQGKLNASVTYKSKDGKLIDVSKLSQGLDFVAQVKVSNTTTKNISNIALTEIFPSGWEIINTRFTDFGDYNSNAVTHTDIRDDSAHFYFDLKSKQSKTINVLLNASYLGDYYLPGIQCEAMYDNAYLARTKGKWVSIVK